VPRKGIALPPKDKIWKPLNKEEVKELANASLEVLNEVGVYVENKEIIAVADKNGCRVDYNKNLIHFPVDTVVEFVSKAPKDFFWAGRTEDDDVIFHGVSKKAYGSFTSPMPQVCIWDENKHEYVYSDATEDDLTKTVRLYDALENVDLIEPPTLDLASAKNGMPQHVHELFTCLSETTKHVNLSNAAPRTLEEWDYYVRLAAEISGSEEALRKRPVISGKSLFTPPLRLARSACYNLLGPTKHGIPLIVGGCNMPESILNAHYIVLHHASVLANVTLAQMLSPGIPCLVDTEGASLHMYEVTLNYSAPENNILNACLIQMVHDHIQLPASNSPWQSAKVTDIQSAYEATLGVSFLWMVGCDAWTNYPFNDFGFNAEMLLFHEELGEYFDHMGKRFRDTLPTKENIAFEAIREVGPLNDFFTHEITLKNLNLQYSPKLADYRTFAKWNVDKKNMLDRIREKIKLLEQHMPPRLPRDVSERMKRIVKEADHKLGV
jgi:trimethylamine--corrinoid protein Co-methyltransferase